MPPAADNPSIRCVLWHPPGVQLPGELLNSLSRRIGHIAVCTDPFTVMAEMCATERDRLLPSSPGPHTAAAGATRPGTVLLLVHPDQLLELPEVLTETRTYAPHALCWKYDARANPKLAAVVDSDVTAWMARGASAAAGVESTANSSRTTNLSDQRPLSSASSPFTPAVTPRRAPASSPVTQQPATAAAAASTPTPRGPVHPSAPPALRLTSDDAPPTPGRPAAPEVVVRPQPQRQPPVPRRGPQPPALTLRGELPPEPDPSAPASPRPRPMLTPEEMRMLLGDDPVEPASGRAQSTNGHHPTPPPPNPTDRGGERR